MLLLKAIGTWSQKPLSEFVPPLVGEAGTLRMQDVSLSEEVNVTCSPVGPDAVAWPEIDVVSYTPAFVARFNSKM